MTIFDSNLGYDFFEIVNKDKSKFNFKKTFVDDFLRTCSSSQVYMEINIL